VCAGKGFYRLQLRKYLFGIIPWYEWTSTDLPFENMAYIFDLVPKNTKLKIVHDKNYTKANA
jgi:hypothetical protein